MKARRGYFGIGCYGMKCEDNYGTLFRTAQVLEADFIFLINTKFKRQATDTMKSWKHLPLYEYENFDEFKKHLPFNCNLIGIELDEKAILLNEFFHPERACYLLGAEDHGIPKEILKECDTIIKLFGKRSLNVSVAGSIVLHDRITKKK